MRAVEQTCTAKCIRAQRPGQFDPIRISRFPAWLAGPTTPSFSMLHQRRRSIVADLKPTLNVRGRGFLMPEHDRKRMVVEVGSLGSSELSLLKGRKVIRLSVLLT